MKKNHISGIIGAIIGGLIASIPWIIVYVYLNLLYSFLAIFIALGALKGYQLFNGKVDKKLPIIITLVSILSITVATFLIIPALLITKESLPITLANLEYLYSSSDFIAAIIRDYIISIIFTFLGISGVIKTIKQQITKNGENTKIDIENNNSKKNREKLKNFFIEKNATTKENAITLNTTMDINFGTLSILMNQKIIICEEGKYYYNKEAEDTFNKKQAKTNKWVIISMVITAIVVTTLVIVAINYIDSNSSNSIDDTNREYYYYVNTNYIEYEDTEYDSDWLYIPKNDLSGYSGYIAVSSSENSSVYSEEWVEYFKDSFKDNEEYKIEKTTHFVNFHSHDVVCFEITTNQEYNYITYFVFGDGNLGIVDVIDYGVDNNLLSDGKQMANTFYWYNENA